MEYFSQLIIWINGSVLLLALSGLISNLWRAGQIFGIALFYFILTGQLSLSMAFGNFVNPVLVTLVLLLLISVALEKNHFIDLLTRQAIDKSYRKTLFKLCSMTAVFSSMLNNTAIVAALMGKISGQKKHAPSRLLIPLSYSAIIGGMLTLIGTSTNLIINSFVVNAGLPPLEFGDFFKIALPVIIAVLTMLIVIGHYILPDKNHLKESYNKFLMEAKVEAGSSLIGKSITDNGLRNLEGIFLLEIWREGRVIAAVRPNRRLREGDVLIFNGDPDFFSELGQFQGLVLVTEEDRISVGDLTEVVVSSGSQLNRRYIRNLGLRVRYDAAVVALSRGNEELTGKLSDVCIETGDRLLLATGSDFRELSKTTTDFHILREHIASGSFGLKSSIISISIFLVALSGVILGLYPLLEGLIGVFAFYLAFNFLKLEELKNRIPYELIMVIGASLGIAQVFTNNGTIELIASGAANYLHELPPWIIVCGLFYMTMLLTEVVTNTVSAALSFPIALGLSQALNMEPTAFIMTIAFAASCSFLTPVGYQTNLMIYSAGNYQITDYLRAGIPTMLVYSITSISLISFYYL